MLPGAASSGAENLKRVWDTEDKEQLPDRARQGTGAKLGTAGTYAPLKYKALSLQNYRLDLVEARANLSTSIDSLAIL